ncbi:hypothetical protein VIGAN_09202400 [Vigna angularis var. angularis]|uniref:Uncharacterized protein n=1 Tax=Vigna angularis var. angularis TaxID=157739 RepID=A0A0S3SZM6_PHAAN|nr:hypothetical protein VIGAN_09202400 [Vigna angularis var. angularis]
MQRKQNHTELFYPYNSYDKLVGVMIDEPSKLMGGKIFTFSKFVAEYCSSCSRNFIKIFRNLFTANNSNQLLCLS